MCLLRYICLTIVSLAGAGGDNSWYDRSGVVWSFQNMKQSIWYVQPVLTIFHVIFISNRVQLSQENSMAVIYWWDHFHPCQGSPGSSGKQENPILLWKTQCLDHVSEMFITNISHVLSMESITTEMWTIMSFHPLVSPQMHDIVQCGCRNWMPGSNWWPIVDSW